MPHLPTMSTLCNYGKTGMDQLPDRDVLILLMVHILLECILVFAGSLEAAYSLNLGAREIWGKGGGETLALL